MSTNAKIKRHVKPSRKMRIVVATYIHRKSVFITGICIVTGALFISPPSYLQSLMPVESTQDKLVVFSPSENMQFLTGLSKALNKVGAETPAQATIEEPFKVLATEDLNNNLNQPIRNVTPQVEVLHAANALPQGGTMNGETISNKASFIQTSTIEEPSPTLEDPTKYIIPTAVPKSNTEMASLKPREEIMAMDVQNLKNRLLKSSSDAKKSGDNARIEAAKQELVVFENTIAAEIDFRIIDREGEKSGFWRAESQDGPKQFFLVVEAVYEDESVNWAIRDFDTNAVVSTSKFGLRVDEEVFRQLSDDKKEDGRINTQQIGFKPVGSVSPIWNVETSGETITGF